MILSLLTYSITVRTLACTLTISADCSGFETWHFSVPDTTEESGVKTEAFANPFSLHHNLSFPL